MNIENLIDLFIVCVLLILLFILLSPIWICYYICTRIDYKIIKDIYYTWFKQGE